MAKSARSRPNGRMRFEPALTVCWQHPTTGAPVRFAVPTIARWCYTARRQSNDPVQSLERKDYGIVLKELGPVDVDFPNVDAQLLPLDEHEL